MRRILLLLTFALAAAACGSDGEVVTAGDDATALDSAAERSSFDESILVQDWVSGVNSAGWDFHKTLEGNAVSSPISIGTAFSFARAGASGDSGEILDSIFGFDAGLDNENDKAANNVALTLAASSDGDTSLDVANRLFPDNDFQPKQEFVDVGARYYGAQVQVIDTADGDAAAADINSWVNDQTRGLVPEIVQADSVVDRALFLINTVYLNALWQTPFLPDLTVDADFTTDAGSTVTASFMRTHEPETRNFVSIENADAIELPYSDGDLAMWIVVPSDVNGLAEVEASLTADDLIAFPKDSRSGLVDLTMPKWEIELPPTDLFGWLCPLGLCPGAPFGEIASSIFIDSAVHGAKIIVDENGTEAGAATAIGFNESAAPLPDLQVVADRPFLWTILHQPTNTLVFVGRVTDPTDG